MKTLAIIVALCSPAVAGHCRQNVVVQKYVAPVVLQQVAPYAYWSVGSAVQEEAFAERMRRIIKQELAAQLKTQQAPAAPEKPLGLTVLQNQCAKCHKPDSKAVVEGKGPALFDALGNLTASQEQVGSILTTVRQGVMPPAPAEPLDDDSYLAVKQYLSAAPK